MFTPPEALTTLVGPWARYYGDSRYAPTIVTFLHLAPIIVGGGVAIAMDRATLRLRPGATPDAQRHLAEIGAAHGVVIGSLALVFLTGVALLAADLETYLPSWVFWLKMGLIALLLANGAVMQRVERGLRAHPAELADRWGRLRGTAITSLLLWLVITLLGVVLVNAA